MHGSENFMSHYEFLKAIALAWIVPSEYWPVQEKKVQIPEGLIISKKRKTRSSATSETSSTISTSTGKKTNT